MLEIPYTASNFPPNSAASLVGAKVLHVTWPEIVWASITVGKSSFPNIFRHGEASAIDAVIRAFRVFAHLQKSSSRLVKTRLYNELDPTEKGGASYSMGMMAGKLIAYRLLDTPWLMHLSRLREIGNAVTLPGKSEPDLVGLTRANRWIVVEAKGRSNKFSPKAQEKAKAQTRQIVSINGATPSLRVAAQAFFTPELNIAIEDPPGFEKGAGSVAFPQQSMLRAYYDSVFPKWEEIDTRKEINGVVFGFRRLEGVGVSLGIDSRVAELVRSEQATLGNQVGLKSFLSGQENGVTLFPDGLAIELDGQWSEEQMLRSPFERCN